jgi:hypothetical protein
VLDEPHALGEKKHQQTRRDALRKIEMEAANPAKPRCHHVQAGRFQFKRLNLLVRTAQDLVFARPEI